MCDGGAFTPAAPPYLQFPGQRTRGPPPTPPSPAARAPGGRCRQDRLVATPARGFGACGEARRERKAGSGREEQQAGDARARRRRPRLWTRCPPRLPRRERWPAGLSWFSVARPGHRGSLWNRRKSSLLNMHLSENC